MDPNKRSLRVGVAGLGTVGQALLAEFAKHGDSIQKRVGCEISLTHVASRTPKPQVNLHGASFSTDLNSLLNDDIDVVVELIGYSNPDSNPEADPAFSLIKSAILKGKHVITGNKAVIALHGNELFPLAVDSDVRIGYEAAVAGGIRIINTLQDLDDVNVDSITGILNGTCNYILTGMSEGADYQTVLAKAQDEGFAEQVPDMDTKGIDTAQKLAILTYLAFNVDIESEKIPVEGIEEVHPSDLKYATQLGYQIRLLGISRIQNDIIDARVHLSLIPESVKLASISGVNNAITITQNGTEIDHLEGEGAGGVPTASSVLLDLERLAGGDLQPPTLPSSSRPYLGIENVLCPHYLCIEAEKEACDMKAIRSAFLKENVGIQHLSEMSDDQVVNVDGKLIVPIVVLTEDATEPAITKVVNDLSQVGNSISSVRRIRVLDGVSPS